MFLPRSLIGMTLAASLLAMPAARAEEPACRPPRCVAESLTINRYTFRFNVLLPSGYGDDGNRRRYPVVYLFMGGVGGDTTGHNRNAWLVNSPLERFTASLPADEQAIVVLPDPGGVLDSIDGTMKWETFHVHTLIPHVDGRYRTIADRAHRAIAGLSWGGFAATHHASRNPDLYVAAGTFSGVPYLDDPPWVAVIEAASLAVYAGCLPYEGGNDPSSICGGYEPAPDAPVGPLGPYATDEVSWRANDPVELAGNLGGVSVYVGAGNGVPCDAEDTEALVAGGDLAEIEPIYYKLEPYAAPQGAAFSAALSRAGVAHTTDLRSCGIHSWRYFWRDLMTFWPQMVEAFGRPSPRVFDFRAVDRGFSIYGWSFEGDEARAPEFLTISDASCDEVGLTGSGITRVRTAPCFEPGENVALFGARDASVTADALGRITFTVDLGAPHPFQQYTPAARALEGAGAYWTSRTVTFRTVAR